MRRSRLQPRPIGRPGLIVLLAASAGCHSSLSTSLDESALFFRFEAGGSPVEFTSLTDVYGVFVGSRCTDREALQIAGWDSANRFGLLVTGPDGFGTGTYSVAGRVEDPRLFIRLYYRSPEGIDYIAQPEVAEDATVVISHVGPETISGAFFGVVRAAGQPDVLITDGAFTVRRVPDILEPC